MFTISLTRITHFQLQWIPRSFSFIHVICIQFPLQYSFPAQTCSLSSSLLNRMRYHRLIATTRISILPSWLLINITTGYKYMLYTLQAITPTPTARALTATTCWRRPISTPSSGWTERSSSTTSPAGGSTWWGTSWPSPPPTSTPSSSSSVLLSQQFSLSCGSGSGKIQGEERSICQLTRQTELTHWL